MGEQLGREMANESATIGKRASLLRSIGHAGRELDFHVPRFLPIPASFFADINISAEQSIAITEADPSLGSRKVSSELVKIFEECLEDKLDEIELAVSDIDSEHIIIRPSPLDENHFSDLSFAGVYKSYIPFSKAPMSDHLLVGTASALAGRYTKYGNRYYERQSINTQREVGLMYTEPFFDLIAESPLVHGTAYVMDGHIRNEYLLRPDMGTQQRSPKVMIARGSNHAHNAEDQTVEQEIDLHSRMTQLLYGLEARYGTPLDVEYLVKEDGAIYVVQARPISAAHQMNWRQVISAQEEITSHSSAVVNSIGEVEGKIIDAREDSLTSLSSLSPDDIIVINHEGGTHKGLHSESFLEEIRRSNVKYVNVIVDHGESRVRDHLQYALVEDPSVVFIVQTTDPEVTQKLHHGRRISIRSNGLASHVTLK